MRIQKYLSQRGIASRREAEVLIRRGLISVNGKVVREMGVQIDPDKDRIAVLPFAKKEIADKTTVAINKPRGIASSRMRSEGTTIYDLLPQFKKLNILGRLDKASEGLLLLSDDGVLARIITGEEHIIEKEYRVTVREDINPGRIKALEPGIMLDDPSNPLEKPVRTLPVKVRFIGAHSFRIILREGRKHQIRRMCQYLHLTVAHLIRLRIGPIALDNLKSGEFRLLTTEEIKRLKNKNL